MNPLDTHNPAELFGEAAVHDLRQLKRAYAQQVRIYGPENDPVTFEHLRRHYEALKSALEGEQLPETGPGAPADSEERIAARIRQTPADQVGQLAQWLELVALDEGIEAAAITRLALAEALTPTDSIGWLIRLAGRKDQQPLATALGRFLLHQRPHQSLCPDWPAFLALLDEGKALLLVGSRVGALVAMGEGEAAEEEFRAHSSALRRVTPPTWLSAVRVLLVVRGPEIPAADLLRIQRELDSVDLEIDADAHLGLQYLVSLAQALQAAAADPQVPPGVLQVLKSGLTADLPTRVHLLLGLMGNVPPPFQCLNHLRHHHPTLHKHLDDLRESISGSNQFMMQWLREGKAPSLVVPQESALQRLEDSLQAADDTESDTCPPTFEQAKIPQNTRYIIGVMILVGILRLLGHSESEGEAGNWVKRHSHQGAELVVAGAIVVVIVLVAIAIAKAIDSARIKVRHQRAAADRKKRREQSLLQGTREEQVLAWLRMEGYFPHELAAVAESRGFPLTLRTAVALQEDAHSDYAVLSLAHLQRVVLQSVAKARATAQGTE